MRDESIRGTLLRTWCERDRLHINLTDTAEETIAEWRDDAARAFCADNGVAYDDHAGIVRIALAVGILWSVATIYTVDANRDADGGGWYENDRSKVGTFANVPPASKPRPLFAWLRHRRIMGGLSQGRASIDLCGTTGEYVWVCQRTTRRPFYAIEYHDAP
jgi:hypothetical protein